MATTGGEQGGSDEQSRQDLPKMMLAPDWGCVEKWASKKFSLGMGQRWKPVQLLARMDLRWIDAEAGADPPSDTRAWMGKCRSIALVRSKTKVIYVKGKSEWEVELDGNKKKFRAGSPEVAAQWVDTLRWRVCPWNVLLKDNSFDAESLFRGFRHCDPSAWPLRLHGLKTAQSVMGRLEAAAKIANDVLGKMPIVGPALSTLGFALEVAVTVKSDAGDLRHAYFRLAVIAKRTMEMLQKAVGQQAKSQLEVLLDLMGLIEEGARLLEEYEYKSTARVVVHGVFKGKDGPSTVLELADRCERLLQAWEVHATKKAVSTLHKEVDGPTLRPFIPIRPETTGKDVQLSKVTKLLLSSNAKYVALLGMGGIGKTTLAHCVMNDDHVQNMFKRDEGQGCLGLSFVTVSQHPDITQCHKKVWDALVGEKVEFTNEEEGKSQLKAKLQGKTYFIVFDDVWKATDMRKLDIAFANGRVLITSRHDEVARVVEAKCHDVTCLDEKNASDLFHQHAFGSYKPKPWQERHIKSIVKNCGGLPLALEIMGKEVKAWRAEGSQEEGKWENAIHELTKSSLFQDDVVGHVFSLSVNSLSPKERSMLLDLATLPEDYLASACDEAELQECIGLSVDERTAHRILRTLEAKALIKQRGQDASKVPEFRPSHGGVHYYLHDVVRDCALRVIAPDLDIVAKRERLVSSQLRDTACMHQTLEAKRFSTSERLKPDQPWTLKDLHMPELKALVLRDAGISELPASVLTSQLRAIDLTSSGITKLPLEISCLKSVQLLRVDYCEKLACLPSEVGGMVQLRVLSMRVCRGIYELPQTLGNLPTLTKLLMPECGVARVDHVGINIWHNLATLDLSKCTGLKQLPSNFGALTRLTALNLGACWQLTSLPDSIGQLGHLQVLILHKCRSLAHLPHTMSQLARLQELDVQQCPRLEIPDAIGLSWSELRILRLQENDQMAFPQFVTNLGDLGVLGIPQKCKIPDSFKQMLEDRQVTVERQATELCKGTYYHMDNATPLHWGAANGLDSMVQFHLNETHVDFEDKYGWTALLRASRGGHTSTAALLLEKGSSVDHVEEHGSTALLYASWGGHTSTAALLLEKGASVDHVNKYGWTALLYASSGGHTSTAALLLEKGSSVDHADEVDGWTALFHASRHGHTSTAALLLEKGASVDHADEGGWTALLYASCGGHTNTAALLLEKGASVDHADEYGWTALLRASGGGHTSTMALLLERGASVDHADEGGSTALLYASWGGHTSTVALLLEKGASVDHAEEYGWTALLRASRHGHTSTAALLIEKGASVDHADEDGWTALLCTSRGGHTSTAALLLEKGASVDHADEDGLTALLHASEGGHKSTAAFLLEKGASVDHVNKDGLTPLMVAAKRSQVETAKFLLSQGADLESTDKDGMTAAQHAINAGRPDLAEMLGGGS